MGKTFLTVLMLAVSAGVYAPAFAQDAAGTPAGQPPLPPGAVTRSACGSPLAAPSVTPPPLAGAPPTLVVRGSVVMGEVKVTD